MRLKKVKHADEIINASSYIVKDYTKNKGKWKEIFKNDNPIRIEVGMGKGDFIINMALKYPNINFIGIEMFDSVLVRAVQKLEALNINNLKLINMDANNIDNVFDKEIDTLYLNFSDPWPKKRHAKRRLTSSVFLKKYDSIFKEECKIIQKTDNIELFAYSIESLSFYGYKLKNITLDLHSLNDEDNVLTEYEKKFIKKGVRICKLEAYKK